MSSRSAPDQTVVLSANWRPLCSDEVVGIADSKDNQPDLRKLALRLWPSDSPVDVIRRELVLLLLDDPDYRLRMCHIEQLLQCRLPELFCNGSTALLASSLHSALADATASHVFLLDGPQNGKREWARHTLRLDIAGLQHDCVQLAAHAANSVHKEKSACAAVDPPVSMGSRAAAAGVVATEAVLLSAIEASWPDYMVNDDSYLAVVIAYIIATKRDTKSQLPAYSLHMTDVGGWLRQFSANDSRLLPRGTNTKRCLKRPRLSEFLLQPQCRPYFRLRDSTVRKSEKIVTLAVDHLMQNVLVQQQRQQQPPPPARAAAAVLSPSEQPAASMVNGSSCRLAPLAGLPTAAWSSNAESLESSPLPQFLFEYEGGMDGSNDLVMDRLADHDQARNEPGLDTPKMSFDKPLVSTSSWKGSNSPPSPRLSGMVNHALTAAISKPQTLAHNHVLNGRLEQRQQQQQQPPNFQLTHASSSGSWFSGFSGSTPLGFSNGSSPPLGSSPPSTAHSYMTATHHSLSRGRSSSDTFGMGSSNSSSSNISNSTPATNRLFSSSAPVEPRTPAADAFTSTLHHTGSGLNINYQELFSSSPSDSIFAMPLVDLPASSTEVPKEVASCWMKVPTAHTSQDSSAVPSSAGMRNGNLESAANGNAGLVSMPASSCDLTVSHPVLNIRISDAAAAAAAASIAAASATSTDAAIGTGCHHMGSMLHAMGAADFSSMNPLLTTSLVEPCNGSIWPQNGSSNACSGSHNASPSAVSDELEDAVSQDNPDLEMALEAIISFESSAPTGSEDRASAVNGQLNLPQEHQSSTSLFSAPAFTMPAMNGCHTAMALSASTGYLTELLSSSTSHKAFEAAGGDTGHTTLPADTIQAGTDETAVAAAAAAGRTVTGWAAVAARGPSKPAPPTPFLSSSPRSTAMLTNAVAAAVAAANRAAGGPAVLHAPHDLDVAAAAAAAGAGKLPPLSSSSSGSAVIAPPVPSTYKATTAAALPKSDSRVFSRLSPRLRDEILSLVQHVPGLKVEDFDEGVLYQLSAKKNESEAVEALRTLRDTDITNIQHLAAYINHVIKNYHHTCSESLAVTPSATVRANSVPVSSKAILQKLPYKVYKRLEEVVNKCSYMEWKHFDAGVIKVMSQLAEIGSEDVFEELEMLEHTDLSNVEYMPAYLNKRLNNRLWSRRKAQQQAQQG